MRARVCARGNLTFGGSPGIVELVTESQTPQADNARPLGEWLRERREELSISLDDAQEATRIRVRYLEALEAEDFEALPNPVVARGFLRNYASYLDLDPQEAADRYTGVDGPAEPEPVPVEEPSPFASESFNPVPLHEMPGRRPRWWLPAALVIVLVALGFLAWKGYPYVTNWLSSVATGGGSALSGRQTSPALATASHSPTVGVLRTARPTNVPSSTATLTEPPPTLELTLVPTPTSAPSDTPSPSPTPTQPVYTGIFLELVFTDTAWIQVTVDGVREFQGELEADTYRSFYGEHRIELRIGNAGVVKVAVNGQKLGTLGEPGDVVDRIFEIVDDQVAEATPTRAPTLAPSELTATAEAPSPTPTATPAGDNRLTVTATITPTLSATPTRGP